MITRRHGFTLAFAALALLACACGAGNDRILIGIALTQSNHHAVQLAVDEINKTGGVGGIPLELVGLDWRVARQFDSSDVVGWAHKFSDMRELVAVIGHSDSDSTLSAAAIYNQRGVPQIVTIATNPAITNIGGWTYRLCISDALQGPALADYAVNDWGKRRIAVIYANDAYGRGLASAFEDRVRSHGAKIVAAIPHRNLLQADDEEMLRAALADLKRLGEPDLIALFQRVEAAYWTLRAIRSLDIRSSLLGGDSLAPASFAALYADVNEGLRVSQFFLPSPEDQRARAFVEAHRSLTQRDPDYGMAFAYDAVYLVRDALVEGGVSREHVKTYIDRLIRRRTLIRGVAGTYRLRPDHDAERAISIVEAAGGRYHHVKTFTVR